MLHKGISNLQTKKKLVRNLPERVLIGTLGVNCLEFTRRTIDTVQTKAEHVTFLYIDNGSRDENVERLKTWKKKNEYIDDFLLAFNGFNAGVAVGWNQIIKFGVEGGFTKIIVCNNDIAFGEYTIDGMIEGFKILKQKFPQTVMVTAANRTKNSDDLKLIKPDAKWSEHPDFSCYMIEPDFVEKIGYINESFKPAFFEDNYTHHKILLTGYKAWSTDLAPYSHIASRTRFGNPDIVSHRTFRENKIVFHRLMMNNSVDQEIADMRYQAWIKDHPDVIHPTLEQVQEHAKRVGLIDSKLIDWLNNLTVMNVPV